MTDTNHPFIPSPAIAEQLLGIIPTPDRFKTWFMAGHSGGMREISAMLLALTGTTSIPHVAFLNVLLEDIRERFGAVASRMKGKDGQELRPLADVAEAGFREYRECLEKIVRNDGKVDEDAMANDIVSGLSKVAWAAMDALRHVMRMGYRP